MDVFCGLTLRWTVGGLLVVGVYVQVSPFQQASNSEVRRAFCQLAVQKIATRILFGYCTDMRASTELSWNTKQKKQQHVIQQATAVM